MTTSRTYFEILPGTTASKAYDDLKQKDKAHVGAVNAFLKSLGDTGDWKGYTRGGVWFVGFSLGTWDMDMAFCRKHGDIWRMDRKERMIVPRRNTPEGKANAPLFDGVAKGVHAHDVARAFQVGPEFIGYTFSTNAMHFMTRFKPKDHPPMLSVPTQMLTGSNDKREKPVKLVAGLKKLSIQEAAERTGKELALV